jgi:hypothetical protein
VSHREIAFDCKFFRGDRPCSWHKQTGVLCTCDYYEKVEERVLVIKLDAMGDVLRGPRIRRTLEGVTGATLIGLGLKLASEER